ncbi:MAG: 3'-5' exonuclease, partial [Candidatus Bathyarchaeia archaeon]
MALRSLDEFFGTTKTKNAEIKETNSPQLLSVSAESQGKEKQNDEEVLIPKNLSPSYFVSATYDGEKRLACIKLYEPVSQRIYLWYDTTGHKPYCFTNISLGELEKVERVISHPSFDHFETIEKYDALSDRKITVTKIVAKDPLAIGGRPQGCIRDIIPEDYPQIFGTEKEVKVWEAAIKYYQCYIYDRDLSPGMIYKIEDGELVPVIYEESEKAVKKIIEMYFKDESKDFMPHLESWTRLMEYPAPKMRRVALDIEVYSPVATRVPDPEEAAHPVICVSLVGSDDKKRVLLLKREKIEEDLNLPSDVIVEFYNSEKDLLSSVFRVLDDYPFVITFNGDDFDLRYIFHRAENIGFNRKEIPIELGRKVCLLRYGVHIDLYKFFFNRSIQIYAFSQKYRNVTL